MFFNYVTLPLVLFTLTMCITPGPNNIMLAASGVQFGFKRSLPHMLGIEVGMLVMYVLSVFGLGVVFDLFPVLHAVLKIAAAVYLLYFAFKTATAKRYSEDAKNAAKPLTLMQGALFQFINPKAWMIVASALASFTQPGKDYPASAAAVVCVFAVVCMPAIAVWAGFGNVVGKYLHHDWAFRSFNILMAALCVYSIAMIF